MMIIRCLAIAAALTMPPFAAIARDDVASYPISDVLSNPQYAGRLEGVRFFFGNEAYPAIERSFGEYQSNKKTNAVNKSDKEACEWVFLSALLSFHQRALSQGGNALINIRGYYKKINSLNVAKQSETSEPKRIQTRSEPLPVSQPKAERSLASAYESSVLASNSLDLPAFLRRRSRAIDG